MQEEIDKCIFFRDCEIRGWKKNSKTCHDVDIIIRFKKNDSDK